MKDNFYKQLIEKLPIGYAYHRIICDKDGNPHDYEFIEVNSAFEIFTGLKGKEIIGKKISKMLPGIKKGKFDWIKVYGEIAIKGGKKDFEQYSESLKRWYKVTVYSPEKYHFITLFNDISKEKEQLLELPKFHVNFKNALFYSILRRIQIASYKYNLTSSLIEFSIGKL